MRKIIAAACVAILLTSCAHVSDHPDTDDNLLNLAVGKWELDSQETADRGTFVCDQIPLIVSVDTKAKRYTAHEGEVITGAQVLYESSNYFWLQYDNEKRKDKNGALVKWAFVFADIDHFYWVRNDWTDSYPQIPVGIARTAMRRRCD